MSSKILKSPIHEHFEEIKNNAKNMTPENLSSSKPVLIKSISKLQSDLESQQTEYDEKEAKLRARQIIYACNEKLLRALIPKLNITEDAFWSKYSFNNLNKVKNSTDPDIQKAWKEVCKELEISEDIGKEYKFLSLDLNIFVHRGSFNEISDIDALKREAASVFGNTSIKQKNKLKRYLDFLDIANLVSKKYESTL